MDAQYAAEYERLYHEHWWWRARERRLEEELRRRAPAEGYGPILDVGCGNGLFFPVLARYGIPEGVEPDPSAVTAAGAALGRIHARPFDETFRPGTRYGLVLMLDVLEHLERPDAALAHAASLLRVGGAVAVTVPAGSALWTSHDERNHHLRRYSKRLVDDSARRAGLRVAKIEFWFGWLAPIKLAVRVKESLLGPSAHLHRVPPAPINRACYLVSRLERSIWGGWLPVGSTLFAWLLPRETP